MPVIVSGKEPVASTWVAVREAVALPGPAGEFCVVIQVGVLETVSAGASAAVPVVEVLIIVDEEPPGIMLIVGGAIDNVKSKRF